MRAVTLLTIATDHPAFAGHFPGRPIVPGALLLDAALHAAAQARQATGERTASGPAMRCQIALAKFLSPVQPGETLSISCTGSDQGQTRFVIASSGRQIATGTFVFESAP